MKFAVFGLVFLISIVASCMLYGWLESGVNMTEGLRQLFGSGATTVIFSPFLVLFLLLCLSVFIATPLLAVSTAGVLGGLMLRPRRETVSRSFVRSFVLVAVICQFAFIFFAIEQDAWFLMKRPRIHPSSPAYVLAFL